jgi:hypothetical protein
LSAPFSVPAHAGSFDWVDACFLPRHLPALAVAANAGSFDRIEVRILSRCLPAIVGADLRWGKPCAPSLVVALLPGSFDRVNAIVARVRLAAAGTAIASAPDVTSGRLQRGNAECKTCVVEPFEKCAVRVEPLERSRPLRVSRTTLELLSRRLYE